MDATAPTPRPLTIALANADHRWIGEVAHVAMLATMLARRGHRPLLAAQRGSRLAAWARNGGCADLLELEFRKGFSPRADRRDLAAWAGWLRSAGADLIHAHRSKDHWLGVPLARRLGLPLVRTRHVVMPVKRHPLNRWLFLHETAAVISVSRAVQAGFGPWAGRLPRGRVILSAVESERFHPDLRDEAWRREHAAPGFRAAGEPEPLWIGLIGRIQRIKGPEEFIEAAGAVARALPEAHFLLAGRGGEGRKRRLRARAEALGFGDRLLILGLVDDLPRLIASLDLGVIASIGSEGSSRVSLELMASGVPIVATRVGGIPELIGQSGAGVLVPPLDAAALGDAIIGLARRPAAERRAAGEMGRRHVLGHHDPDRWCAAMEAVYREVLAGRPPLIVS